MKDKMKATMDHSAHPLSDKAGRQLVQPSDRPTQVDPPALVNFSLSLIVLIVIDRFDRY